MICITLVERDKLHKAKWLEAQVEPKLRAVFLGYEVPDHNDRGGTNLHQTIVKPQHRHGKLRSGFRASRHTNKIAIVQNGVTNRRKRAAGPGNSFHGKSPRSSNGLKSTRLGGTRAKSTRAVNRRLFMPRFRTARESPRRSLADRYLAPARQTARSPLRSLNNLSLKQFSPNRADLIGLFTHAFSNLR